MVTWVVKLLEVFMKSLKWFSVSLIILSFVLSGCLGGDDDDDDLILPGDGSGIGAGFSAMKAGSWSELHSPDGDIDRYEYIGVDTYNGTECYVLEFDSVTQGQKSIMQIWINKATGQAVVMIMKDNKGKVTKMDIPQSYEPPTGTGGEVPTTATNLGKKKYTTPTGKTVDAVAYKITTPYGEVETWSSAQVPFGEVKTITNGEVMSELYDFGTSGAVRDISKQEAENAKPFGFGDIDLDDQGGGGDIGGGDDDIGDIGNIQIGDIAITVGAGGRPDIKVSKPITSLMVNGEGVVWGFNVNDGKTLPGPFKYGVLPNGTTLVGVANPPDLKAGVMYTIQAKGAQANSIGSLIFFR
jgi:hypothetical protein